MNDSDELQMMANHVSIVFGTIGTFLAVAAIVIAIHQYRLSIIATRRQKANDLEATGFVFTQALSLASPSHGDVNDQPARTAIPCQTTLIIYWLWFIGRHAVDVSFGMAFWKACYLYSA